MKSTHTDCHFKIYPMHRYNAQRQWKKAKASSNTLHDIVLLKKLQHAAEAERKQNEQEDSRALGQVIQYGQCIQVYI